MSHRSHRDCRVSAAASPLEQCCQSGTPCCCRGWLAAPRKRWPSTHPAGVRSPSPLPSPLQVLLLRVPAAGLHPRPCPGRGGGGPRGQQDRQGVQSEAAGDGDLPREWSFFICFNELSRNCNLQFAIATQNCSIELQWVPGAGHERRAWGQAGAKHPLWNSHGQGGTRRHRAAQGGTGGTP